MGLGDPFSTTYEGAYKAGTSLGTGIQSAATSVADAMKLQNSQKRAMATLKMLQDTGIQKKEEPLSTDEFNTQAESIIRTNADKLGTPDLQITGSTDPEERMKQYKAILDPLGLTPKPKVTNVLDTNAMSNKFDISVDSDGKLSYKMKTVDPLTEELKKQRLDNANKVISDRESESLNKNLVNMSKQLDPSQYRAGAFGDSKKVFDRGERLSSLMDSAVAFQKGGADSRQINELAIGMNSMLAGNNVSAVEQVKGLVPSSAIGNASKLAEWLSNEPTGTNQQDFVNRMMNTVNNEMATTKSQMDRTRFQRLSGFSEIEKKHPDEFNNILQSYGINPEDYQAWKKGGYKNISAIQEKQAGPGGSVLKAAGLDNNSSKITEENIQHTLKLHPEVTREQLLKQLGG